MSEETTETQDLVVTQTGLPANLRKLYLKAESAMELRNWGYAVSLLQAILVKEPAFLDGRKMLRLAALKEKEGKKGVKLGGEALKVLKMQGQLKKDPLGVIAALEKDVLASDPRNPQGNELLYEASLAAGMGSTGAFALQTVIDGDPDNAKFQHRLGDFHMERGEFGKASEIYGKIAEKNRADLDAGKKYKDATAQASMKQGGWDQEGDWRDKLKDKDAAKSLEKEGRAAMTQDMLQEQAERLLAEYSADQNNLDVVKRLARTYEDLEDFPSALQYYEWAFHLSQNDPALEKKVGAMRDTVNKSYLKELRDFIEQNPGHPDLEQVKAQLAEAEKTQINSLVDEAQARVDRNPTDNELRYELGSHLFTAERFREAIQHLQQAKSSPNLRIKVMNMLGQCYDKMGMTDLAKNQLEEAIKEL
ncbi:MAG: hypothetical protein AAF236_17655, partial [Verrucomicrobiota bacterium]